MTLLENSRTTATESEARPSAPLRRTPVILDLRPRRRALPARDTVGLFGLDVDPLTLDESVARAEALINTGVPKHHVCINAAKVVGMRRDERLAEVLAHADMVNVDGQSIVWASRLLRARVPERVAGIDFMEALIERAAQRGWGVYFLGATDRALDSCIDHFQARFPELIVSGAHNGYWTEAEQPEVLGKIAASGAQLVLVALPTPRKEHLVGDHLADFGNALVVGVGGSFDVFGGLVTRAPKWAQRWGLEWAHRLAKEPRRMWKRYLVGNSKFCALVARTWWQTRVLKIEAGL